MKSFRYLMLFFIIVSCFKNEDKIFPTERPLTESVYSSITIQPDSLYQAYAIVAGILDNNLVEEGDVVLKNKTLIQITNSTPKLNAQNAKFTLNLAKENYNGNAAVLNSILEEIAAAKLKYKNDSINYFRQKNLWDQRIGSKVEFDTRKLNYELASNSLKLLQNKYNSTKNELHTAVKQAQNNYQSALINTKDFMVKSKINGKVYALYKEAGEIVTTMEPLASIGSATHFVINMLVDEVDIVSISKNQEVIIHLDAYKDEVFKGRVSKIYPKKDERNQTFKVEAVFENPPHILYPGLSGEANIIIAKKDRVLTIPKAYLIEGNKVKTDDGLTPISTGMQNMEYIEVLSGITKDTQIYKPE
ncbi:MAG: efflux RND transporter periplasmic adaptor subunit [Algibacter sp.]|uniref:efflux RND transporter periplasmic adaptor subunit n=1 Tax=Algibacter sp. TaxID=1872428 RepID=UPI002618E0B2|nr:efflux RND transporter periplasmic adaptor subunit [Algibacter sp.]MDG1730373.1 efflux RND transporter periplasmic adaptor subunit [Algibacter sp.]MDG2178851.1 efflux RND transporter periplasmic adaptor subunit [Algibacter sp.]